MVDMKFITDDDGQDRADAAGACGEAAGRRLGQLRRRLGHGRARRPDRPRRAGHRGRDLDRSGAAGRGRERRCSTSLRKNGEKAGVGQGAMVAMTPDGAVRALVGGRNYAESQFNRAVAAKRQPGSAFKPFVYLTAIERGLTPDTMREDKPIAIKGWKPENYSREYFGPVTLSRRWRMSLNTVSVRLTLGVRADRGDAHRAPARHRLQARAERLDRARHLGSLGARAGSAPTPPFANGGMAVTPHVVERVRDRGRQDLCTSASPQSLGRIVEPRYVGDDECDDAGDARSPAPRARPSCRAGPPPARPAPRRISATPGSSATPGTSSPASGSATTTTRRRKKTTGGGIAGRHLEPLHEGRRTRACRSPPCPACRARPYDRGPAAARRFADGAAGTGAQPQGPVRAAVAPTAASTTG